MRALILLLAFAGTAAAIDSRHSYVSEHELQGFGDFNGDGLLDLVVVDRASGNFRVGAQTGSSSIDWHDPQPSGVPGADAIAVGRVGSTTEDQLLVAGMFANRVHLLEPGQSIAKPVALELDGIGPVSIAALDVAFAGNDPTRDDLVAITAFNSDADRKAIFRTTAAGIENLSELDTAKPQRRGTRVFPTEGGTPWHGFLELDDGSDTESFVMKTPGVANAQQIDGLPVGSDFLAAPLMSGNANQLVFWLPGSPILRIGEITAGPTLNPLFSHDLGALIESVYIQEIPSGITLFVTFGNGGHATSYRLDASGTPVALQSFTAPTGQRVNGLLGFASGSSTMLFGPVKGGTSTRFQQLAYDGSTWRPNGGGDLPAVGKASAGTNIFLYDREPLVDSEAKLVQTLHIADWSSALAITGGATPTATIVSETYTNAANGLDSSSPKNLGALAGDVAFGLPNQLFPQASLSIEGGIIGAATPAISINPPAGEYDRHVAPVLVSDATNTYYRRDNGDWQSFTGDPITSNQNGSLPFTIYYYAETDSARSPIFRADYTFTGEPGSIDTDGDGVPDFVEYDYGLDPTAGADSDEDGYPDLLELLQGSDPNDAGSVPAPGGNAIEFGGVFDLALKPISHDGLPAGGPENASWAASNQDHTPTNLRAFSTGGALLGQAATEIDDRDSLIGPSVFLESLPGDERDLFVTVGTDPTFDTKPDDDTASGRELLGLVPVPHLEPIQLPLNVSPADDGSATAWVADAQAAYADQFRPLLEQTLTLYDSLELLVLEKVLGDLVGTPFSFTGFRDPAPLGEPDPDALRALQTNTAGDSYLLRSIFAEVATQIDNDANLQLLAEQLYQISAANGDADPGAYPNPFDTLRAALAGDPLPSSYATGVTANLTAAAAFTPTLTPRPTASFTAEMSGFGLRNTADATPLRLFDADGSPFVLPRGIELPVGATLEILAFTDRTTLPAGPGLALEAISATLASIPSPPREDTDRNLLDDAWQNHYFADTEVSPFSDPDGDGYSTFQEMLEGTNPTRANDRPTGPRLPLAPPPIDIEPAPGGDLRVFVHFPSKYAVEVGFALLADNGRAIRFDEIDSDATPDGSDTFGLQVTPPPSDSQRLFRFRMFLKR